MAKLPSGILGPVSGKIGPVIGGVWKGIPYIKEVDQNPKKKKKTERQLANEAKFKFINEWLVPLHPFFTVGFYKLAVGKTTIAAGLSANYQNVFTGIYPDLNIQLDEMIICSGKLPMVNNPRAEFVQPDQLKFCWDKNSIKGTQYTDQIMVALFNPEEGFCDGFIGGVSRSAEQYLFKLGEESIGKPLHVYIGAFSLDRNKISNSQYIGQIAPTL